MDSPEFKSRFEEDPYAAMREAVLMHRKEVAEYVDLSRKDLIEQRQREIRHATDPTRTELRTELEELSAIRGFAQMEPEAQLEMAKKFRESKPAEGVKPPAGSPAGNGVGTPPAPRETEAERDDRIRKSPLYQQYGRLPGQTIDNEVIPVEGV